MMMDEIREVASQTNPDEILLNVDGMTGQDAIVSAKVFTDQLEYYGPSFNQNGWRLARWCGFIN